MIYFKFLIFVNVYLYVRDRQRERQKQTERKHHVWSVTAGVIKRFQTLGAGVTDFSGPHYTV